MQQGICWDVVQHLPTRHGNPKVVVVKHFADCTAGSPTHLGYAHCVSEHVRMWRHNCFATVHDCPYWQLFSGA
jgi:hypothetical protein